MTTDNKTTWLPTTTAWVPTTALIDFMSRHRPDEVEILRQQYQQKLLQPAQPPLAAEREKIAYKRSVVTKSLDNFDERREVALSWLRRRIDRANIIQLVGNIVTAISGAGVISAVVLQSYAAAVVTAIIGFLSSCLMLISQHLQAPLGKKLSESLDDLVKLGSQIVRLRGQLAREDSESQVLDVEQKAVEVTASITEVEAVIGRDRLEQWRTKLKHLKLKH